MAKRQARQTFIQRSRSIPAERKALFHQEVGAGKSHVKRPFIGLTESETAEVERRITTWIDGVVGQR